MSIRIKTSVGIIVVGLIMTIVGLLLSVPGTHLTTVEELDGEIRTADGTRYAAIEEYVGGDAYNLIIGAELVGNRISGTLAMKAVFIAVGIMISCIGAVEFAKGKYEEENSCCDYDAAMISQNKISDLPEL